LSTRPVESGGENKPGSEILAPRGQHLLQHFRGRVLGGWTAMGAASHLLFLLGDVPLGCVPILLRLRIFRQIMRWHLPRNVLDSRQCIHRLGIGLRRIQLVVEPLADIHLVIDSNNSVLSARGLSPSL